jgi:hypothetical protein
VLHDVCHLLAKECPPDKDDPGRDERYAPQDHENAQDSLLTTSKIAEIDWVEASCESAPRHVSMKATNIPVVVMALVQRKSASIYVRWSSRYSFGP